MALLCTRCGQERVSCHSPTAPHSSITSSPCEGYRAEHPCSNPEDTGGLTSDVELHDVEEPHARAETDCPAVETEWRDPTFEGGGGSSGGGGASGGW